MAVTKAQVALVQGSWAKVAPLGLAVAGLFYDRLFAIDPQLTSLFHTDMASQREKLVQMLNLTVRGLNHVDALVPAVRDLGMRHVRYGVEDAHYDSVGAALLQTLEACLGDAFTPDARDAWTAVYTLLATTMKEASRATVT